MTSNQTLVPRIGGGGTAIDEFDDAELAAILEPTARPVSWEDDEDEDEEFVDDEEDLDLGDDEDEDFFEDDEDLDEDEEEELDEE